MKKPKKNFIFIFESLNYEKILSFDLWIIKNQDSENSKKNYHQILGNLKKFFF